MKDMATDGRERQPMKDLVEEANDLIDPKILDSRLQYFHFLGGSTLHT